MGIVDAGPLRLRGYPADLLERVEDVIFNLHADATERLVHFAEPVKGSGTKRK